VGDIIQISNNTFDSNEFKKQTGTNWNRGNSESLELGNFNFGKKIFYHPENITALKQGKRPFPITLEIDLTNRCNHNCSFCNYAERINTSRDSLDTSVLKTRLKEAKTLGTKAVVFSGGGEPMLHKDYFEIIDFTKQVGFDVGTISNGSIIAENNVDTIVKSLQWIRISLAGGDRDSYKKVQGVDQFDKIIENLKLLSDVKIKKNNQFNIGIRTLVTPENVHTLINLARIIKNFKINYLQFAPDQYTTDKGLFWNNETTRTIFNEVKEILKTENINLLGTAFMREQEKLDYPTTCYAHFFKGAILAEGDYAFCQNVKDHTQKDIQKYLIGNIYKSTLSEIWSSDMIKDIESWVRPNNCGLFCKHMAINNSLEEVMNPNPELSPNFVG